MTEPAPRSTTAAWAAAAVVLAVGALGFAVAANLRSNDLEERLARLESSRPSGGATTTTPVAAVVTTTTSEPVRSTDPAPADPAVTGPTDPEAARRDVAAALARVYDGTIGPGDRVAAVDDPSGVEAALDTLYNGPFAGGARSSRAMLVDVAFASSTRAAVTYAVAFDGAPMPTVRTGEVRVAGGAWKVTRATVCADLAALQAPCP